MPPRRRVRQRAGRTGAPRTRRTGRPPGTTLAGEGARERELERAEKRYAQAKARLQALKNREAAKERKIDTRRKVILGGALMDLAGRDDGAAAMLDRLLRNLPREQDRKTFEGWSPEAIDAAPPAEPSRSGAAS